jgi:hypothetical protein
MFQKTQRLGGGPVGKQNEVFPFIWDHPQEEAIDGRFHFIPDSSRYDPWRLHSFDERRYNLAMSFIRGGHESWYHREMCACGAKTDLSPCPKCGVEMMCAAHMFDGTSLDIPPHTPMMCDFMVRLNELNRRMLGLFPTTLEKIGERIEKAKSVEGSEEGTGAPSDAPSRQRAAVGDTLGHFGV